MQKVSFWRVKVELCAGGMEKIRTLLMGWGELFFVQAVAGGCFHDVMCVEEALFVEVVAIVA